MRKFLLILIVLSCGLEQSLQAQPSAVNNASPAIEVLYVWRRFQCQLWPDSDLRLL